MIWIYGAVLLGFVCFGLYCNCRGKHTEKGFFKEMAGFLYEKIYLPGVATGRLKKTASVEAFYNLHHSQAEEKWKNYFIHKTVIMLKLFFFGTVAATMVSIFSLSDAGKALDTITRNDIGMGERQIILEASQGEMEEEIVLLVGEKRYTQAEIEQLYKELITAFDTLIFEPGDSYEKVRHPLFLPTQVQEYPFEIVWESSDYEVVDSNGAINFEEVQEAGTQVVLTAIVSYYDFYRYEQIPIVVYPQELTGLELFRQNLQKALEKTESETKEQKDIVLPDSINGQQVLFWEKQEDQALKIWIFAIIMGVLIFLYMDKKVIQKGQLRQEQLLRDYAPVVSKLTLYTGAGLSLRHAFHKTAFSEGKTGFVYQEMQRVCHEMENGISEKTAYDRFGTYCNNKEYIKLALLLNQNLLKGSNRLNSQLKEEMEEAFEKRKNQARKLGKEAGVKLLGPMMIMLAIVMLFIMVPAFFSFT